MSTPGDTPIFWETLQHLGKGLGTIPRAAGLSFGPTPPLALTAQRAPLAIEPPAQRQKPIKVPSRRKRSSK